MAVKRKFGISRTKSIKNLLAKKEKIGVKFVGKYPNDIPVQEVALMQEFGTDTIPPRPFLRNAKIKYRKNWQIQASKRIINVYVKGRNYENELKLYAKSIRKDIKQSIIDTNSPALAESTLWSRKSKEKTGKADYSYGFTTPLIETGRMLRNLRVQIKK